LNDNPNASFRIVFNGASAANGLGNNRIDNLTISATALPVPEPPSWLVALMIAGVIGLVLRVRAFRALHTG
jgi:PEP-CTERM motif